MVAPVDAGCAVWVTLIWFNGLGDEQNVVPHL
jgi:hypothetical protein